MSSERPTEEQLVDRWDAAADAYKHDPASRPWKHIAHQAYAAGVKAGMGKCAPYMQHHPTCHHLTMVLTCSPPKPAPCDCGLEAIRAELDKP